VARGRNLQIYSCPLEQRKSNNINMTYTCTYAYLFATKFLLDHSLCVSISSIHTRMLLVCYHHHLSQETQNPSQETQISTMAMAMVPFQQRLQLLLMLWTIGLVSHVTFSLSAVSAGRATSKQQEQIKPRVMFICKANSCRSQMAHGFLEDIAGHTVTVESSGCIEASTVNLNAVTVMKEVGVDISQYTSHALTEYSPFDGYAAVVSLCGCLEFVPDTWKSDSVDSFVDWDLDDPPALDPGDLSVYRRVRDEVLDRVQALSSQLLVDP
jgi:arsenate reductase